MECLDLLLTATRKQKSVIKAVDKYSLALKFVPSYLNTQKICNKVV